MRVVCDIETDKLNATKLWCVVCKDIDTEELYIWRHDRHPFFNDVQLNPPFDEFASKVTEWWGHNFLYFDAPIIKQFLGVDIPHDQIKDTLILSRLFFPMIGGRKKILKEFKLLPDVYKKGKHSLADWGERLGIGKFLFENFSECSQEMVDYCIQDVEVCDALRKFLQKRGQRYSKLSVNLEHEIARILRQQTINGFKFEVEKAQKLHAEIHDKAQKLEEDILQYFPPKAKADKECTPVETNKGGLAQNRLYGFSEKELVPNGTFTRIEWKEFNLASPKQLVERLEPYWEPYIKTPTGQWSTSEENLATIKDSAPEDVKKIHTWSILNKRLQNLVTWLKSVGDDDRIHGKVDSCGTWTYRCSHYDPNTANIVAVTDRKGRPNLYGKEMRELWSVEKGNVLVGTDASSIQLRVLAHYINHPDYTKEVVEGDVHSKNQEYMDGLCDSREQAKTFIYAWLLGSSAKGLAKGLKRTPGEAKRAEDLMISKTPGFRQFLSRKRQFARYGWMKGLDGRINPLPSEHRTLAIMLQEGESTIMKLAYALWYKWAKDRGLRFKNVAFVHDEWQTECHPDDAEKVGRLQVKSLKRAGKILKLNCPLDGKFDIGKTWAETH